MSCELISAVSDTITAVAATAAVIVAGIGLTTWIRQLHGTTEYDLSRRLLLQVYRVRDALKEVRRPFLAISEAGSVPDGASWEVAAYQNRWQRVRDAMLELQAIVLECEVLWGDSINPLLTKLDQHVRLLLAAVDIYMMAKQDPQFAEDFTREHRNTLYATSADDPYNAQLSRVVSGFEAYVKPHLKRGGNR
jgi:hypothetical protein